MTKPLIETKIGLRINSYPGVQTALKTCRAEVERRIDEIRLSLSEIAESMGDYAHLEMDEVVIRLIKEKAKQTIKEIYG